MPSGLDVRTCRLMLEQGRNEYGPSYDSLVGDALANGVVHSLRRDLRQERLRVR
jgi:hypothetical protein